jgi:hypothetical protein
MFSQTNGCQIGKLTLFTLGVPILNDYILAFQVAQLAQFVAKIVDQRIGRGANPENSNARHFRRLLRLGYHFDQLYQHDQDC